jgi:acyl transferase domain-containing protein/NADPH:quinone reductase-like Zn-dependent oxidoreductase
LFFLLILLAKSRESLRNQVAKFNIWLQETSISSDIDDCTFLARVSLQLLLKRTISYPHLAIFISVDRVQLQQQIDAFLAEEAASGLCIIFRPPILPSLKLCFVFSGEDLEWWAMGRQLYKSEPIFSQWIRRIDAELTKVNNGEWHLLHELIETSSESESHINDIAIALPALFAVQVALAALLVSWHIYPSTIVSYGVGEQAAAFVSGRVTLQEALRIVYCQSRLQHRNTAQGGRMLTVSMSEKEVQNKLLKGIEHLVCIAAVNSPQSVTLNGDEKTIDELHQILSTFYPNVSKSLLRIENAFHSCQMDRFDIEKEMLSSLRDIPGLRLQDLEQMFDVKCAQARLYSSVLGNEVGDQMPLDANYWWCNVRQCVRFSDAITSIVHDEAATTFLELSPHPVLATSIRECFESKSLQCFIFPTLKRKEDEQITLLNSVAQLATSPDIWQHYFKSRHVLPMKDETGLFDTFPLYAFHLSSCWYESKELVIERLATRLPTHPLLGIRQWTGHMSATWKSLINLNLREYAFLKDYQIQDTILFPAACFLELAVAACCQLIRSKDKKQPQIVFEQIEFVQALPLSKHKLTEVFTEVRMPMHEWFVYSRPWTSSDEECMRSSGLSGRDVVDSFVDPQTLNEYSLRQFTLHAHGRIEMSNVEQKLPSIATVNDDRETWSTNDSASVYAHLSTRGYQYGTYFQLMKSLHGTSSTVSAQIDSSLKGVEDIGCYSMLHPTVMDACFHPLLALLPGVGTTFLPVSIQKFTSFGKLTTSRSTLQARGNYHANICGVALDRTYHCDLVVASEGETAEESLFIFEDFAIQQIPGSLSARWITEKSVFDKLNASIHVPNADLTIHFDTIMTEYCLKTVWTDVLRVTSVAGLLPSPEKILDNEINHVNEEDLVESVEPLNELAACYAQLAIEHLDRNLVSQHHHQLLTACCSLASRLQEQQVTPHSTQIRCMNLFKQFPRLRPLLTVLTTHGSHLRQILMGEQDRLEMFLDTDEMKQALQQTQTLICASKIRFVFYAIDQHLRQQHDQDDQKSLIGRRLRVIWLGNGIIFDNLLILQLWLDLSRETSLFIDLNYVESDPVRLAQAQQTFDVHCMDQNRFNVTYNKLNENVDVESYDIVFAANKMQGSQDLTSSLITLRRLLVPNGLLLLLEMTKVPLYFDLIFGLFDQWWSPFGNGRALLDIHQWTTSLQLVDGFVTVQTMSSQYTNSLIIAQKSTSSEILQTLDERQQQAWLLFADNGIQSICHSLTSLLPCKNITFVHHSNSSPEDVHSILKLMITKYEQLHVVFAWPLEQTSLDDNSELAFMQHELMCGTLVHILQTIEEAQPRFHPFVYVLTRHAQPNDSCNFNPIGASFIGLVRSLMIEYERHRLKIIDLQSLSTSVNEPLLVHALAQHFEICRYADHLDEIVLCLDKQKDRVKQVEWHYEMLHKQQQIQSESKSQYVCIIPQRDADQQPFRIRVAPSRFLTDLAWVSDQLTREILPGMVEVRVHCVGLNFCDALKALGLHPHVRAFAQSNKDQSNVDRDTELGSDFVGTVVRSFSDANLQPGTRVVGIWAGGTLHSHVVVDTCQLVRIPDGFDCLTDDQLAAMPTNCLTVLYTLKYRVHLKRGQTVLVHAATDGAGQICIQYCHAVGARVLATADSDKKRHFLRKHCGVEHVFSNQDFSFVHGVHALLPDGVDVVVNSSRGRMLQESMKLLSPHGHFVEWGRQNIYNKSHLSMFDLRADCSFHIIDLLSLSDERLPICGDMLQEMMQLLVDGKLKSIEPTVIYEPSQVVEAFTRCISDQTMGNPVVRIISSDQPLYLNVQQHNDSNRGKISIPLHLI